MKWYALNKSLFGTWAARTVYTFTTCLINFVYPNSIYHLVPWRIYPSEIMKEAVQTIHDMLSYQITWPFEKAKCHVGMLISRYRFTNSLLDNNHTKTCDKAQAISSPNNQTCCSEILRSLGYGCMKKMFGSLGTLTSYDGPAKLQSNWKYFKTKSHGFLRLCKVFCNHLWWYKHGALNNDPGFM